MKGTPNRLILQVNIKRYTEPICDGSRMIHMSNMDEEQIIDSESSLNTKSETEEENSEPKATTQQSQTISSEQLTLQPLSRPAKKDSVAMEDKNGILVHGH